MEVAIQRIVPEKLELFKAVRLRALQDSPLAFGSTYEREASFSEQEWRSRLDRWSGETGIGFLAMDGEVACGIGGALLDSADSTRAQLVSMWTAPGARGKGVGAALVNAVIGWMRAVRAGTLVLMVTSTNEPAIRFYSGLGFVMTGRTEPYPNDPRLVELEMARSIEVVAGATEPT